MIFDIEIIGTKVGYLYENYPYWQLLYTHRIRYQR